MYNIGCFGSGGWGRLAQLKTELERAYNHSADVQTLS